MQASPLNVWGHYKDLLVSSPDSWSQLRTEKYMQGWIRMLMSIPLRWTPTTPLPRAAELFCKYLYFYVLSMMTRTPTSPTISQGADYASIVPSVAEKNYL